MKDEYIIINKLVLEKRIKELEKQANEYAFNANRTDDYYRYISMIKVLKEILSQSTPLIPEIEKAFEAGRKLSVDGFEEEDEKDYRKFISQLKLPI